VAETTKRKPRQIPAEEVFAGWRKEPGFQQAYNELEEEFAIMATLIKARTAADLSQTEVARRMKTTQSAVARLEGRGHRASLDSLRSYAQATGHRLRITLEPVAPKQPRPR